VVYYTADVWTIRPVWLVHGLYRTNQFAPYSESSNRTLCRIELFADSAAQAVNRWRSCVSGHSSTALEQVAWQCHVSQFVVGFPAATETHGVPAVIPNFPHIIIWHFL